MLARGDAFFYGKHVWFVLSDPACTEKVLCVNLTTLDEECPDDECILSESDYFWIEEDHPTAVAFTRAKIWDVKNISNAIADGKLKRPYPKSLPPETIAKVLAAAKTSRELSADKKLFL